MALYTFNSKDVPDKKFELLPDGWYPAIIIGSEIGPTNRGDGTKLTFTFKIIEGAHINRNIFYMAIIDHPNNVSVIFGQQRIQSITDVLEIPNFTDTEELHGKELDIYVTTRKLSYKKTNEITKELTDKKINETTKEFADKKINEITKFRKYTGNHIENNDSTSNDIPW